MTDVYDANGKVKAEIADGMMALIRATRAICDAVEAVSEGIAEGTLYAVLCDRLPLDRFNKLVELAVASGRITKTGFWLKKAA